MEKKKESKGMELGCMVTTRLDYNKCKERLFVRLVNRDRNEKLWRITQFEPWNDLALTVRCILKNKEQGLVSFLVTKQHLDYWGVSWEEVFEIAKANTPKLFPFQLREFTSFLSSISIETDEEWSNDREYYIATNQIGLNGATVVIYPEFLQELKERFLCDLYLIPSSIHEFMIYYDDHRISAKSMREIIKDANRVVVEEYEVLSYQLYKWSYRTGEITICKE